MESKQISPKTDEFCPTSLLIRTMHNNRNIRSLVLGFLDLRSVRYFTFSCSGKTDYFVTAIQQRPKIVYIFGAREFIEGIYYDEQTFEILNTKPNEGYTVQHGGESQSVM